jgi:fructokinase
MLPRTHLLKESDEDLSLLYPQADVAGLARGWLDQGVAMVVVTRGGEGAWAWTAQHHVAVPATPTALVDTVGAGDTFQSALLAWLAEHDLLAPGPLRGIASDAVAQALHFAGRAAAITCSRRGADLPRRDELAA